MPLTEKEETAVNMVLGILMKHGINPHKFQHKNHKTYVPIFNGNPRKSLCRIYLKDGNPQNFGVMKSIYNKQKDEHTNEPIKKTFKKAIDIQAREEEIIERAKDLLAF